MVYKTDFKRHKNFITESSEIAHIEWPQYGRNLHKVFFKCSSKNMKYIVKHKILSVENRNP